MNSVEQSSLAISFLEELSKRINIYFIILILLLVFLAISSYVLICYCYIIDKTKQNKHCVDHEQHKSVE